MSNNQPDNDGAQGVFQSSAHARLIRSGLLDQGAAHLTDLLRRDPKNGLLWRRLADTRRMNGNLAEAETGYRTAAEHGDRPEENQALAELCAGRPRAVIRLPVPSAAPFLLSPSPLSQATRSAVLEVMADDAVEARPARVGKDRELLPEIRTAVARSLPSELLGQVLADCAPIFERATRELFVEPVALEGTHHALVGYDIGGGYRVHRDAGGPGTPSHGRVLSLLLYIDTDPAGFTGGDLLLHDRAGNAMTLFRPKSDMAIAFPSEDQHQVTRVEPIEPNKSARRVVLVLWRLRAGAEQRTEFDQS